MKEPLLVLNDAAVREVLTMADAIRAVEEALKELQRGRAQLLERRYLDMPRYKGKVGLMPAYVEGMDAAGVKLVGAFEDNVETYGLPRTLASLVLVDPRTGRAQAFMDATYITMMRTGAIGALAARELAADGPLTVGLLGAGPQAETQLLGLQEVVRVRNAQVHDPWEGRAEGLVDRLEGRIRFPLEPCPDPHRLVEEARLVITATTSTVPVLKNEWVRPGTHVTSIGVSVPGREELPAELFARSRLVVDYLEQTSRIGGIQVALQQGKLNRSQVYAQLGEILLGHKRGRQSADEVTVFVASGLSIQDMAVAQHVYQRARELGIGARVDF
ncbi:MAG: ornithine cyclodeaminase family protein [Acidobacteria bacterium]|nr:ornithine cyclodeaminase family protein [Acidobacteriota bacterium]